MAYDEALAERVRAAIGQRDGVVERQMFGGLAFVVNGHMACGVQGDRLVLRLGTDATAALRQPHTAPMDFTGKPLASMIYVHAPGTRRQADLRRWLGLALRFVERLPPK
jgi:TfoX/Sxy family transcriptional regulator of competence genes